MNKSGGLSGVEAVLQNDGTWAFFVENTTIHALPYREGDGQTIKLKPVRGDSVRHGEWLDLQPSELATYCNKLQLLAQLLFGKVGEQTMNNCYGSTGDMQQAHLRITPEDGEEYKVIVPVSDTDDMERQESEIREWVSENLLRIKSYKRED